MPRYSKALSTEIQVCDKLTGRLVTVRRKARLFDVGGVKVKLLEIASLCAAIDRTHRTILNWERAGRFPKPMFTIPGSRTKRWYSEAQIQALNKIWLRYRGRGKARHFPIESFLQEVRDVFYVVDVNLIKQQEAANG